MEQQGSTERRDVDDVVELASELYAPDSSPDNSSDAKSLRILRISTDTYPEILGGGAIHAHELSQMQAEMGHHVTLLTSDHGDRSAPRRETRAGYEVRRYRQVARPFGNSITPGLVSALWGLIDGFDVVHAHSHLYFSSNVAAALTHFSDTPFVLTNHGLYSQSAPGLVQTVFMKTVARPTFNAADRVLCYTDTDRGRLRNLGISAPISVIHNGIDCSLFSPSPQTDERLQVLFVGRLKKSKGVCQLLEAFAALAPDLPDATLKLVGSGPLRPTLEKAVIDYGIEDRVTFTGRLSNDELPAVYDESAVFVLPSTAEGFPRTVLEALACETPVVTSDLPQLESFIDGVGETVPPNESSTLENVLRELLTDARRREELGKNGRTQVLNRYSWKDTVAQTTQVYHELLN